MIVFEVDSSFVEVDSITLRDTYTYVRRIIRDGRFFVDR